MDEAALLAALPLLAFQAVVIFARMGAAVMLLPGIGEAELPAPVRLGIGVGFVPVLLPVLGDSLPTVPDALPDIARLLLVEIGIGIWIGSLARVAMLGLSIAAQFIAGAMGLTSALVQDPALGQGGTALSRLIGLAAVVMVMTTGLHHLAIAAMAESYAVLPAGLGFPAEEVAQSIVAAGADNLGLALRLSAPFLVGAVIANVGLGLLARLAPQIQVYFVAVPGQVLAGIALLALLMPAFMGVAMPAIQASFSALPGAH
ncbi:flagellar biosynthetic protein FliR [Acetobacteraceae bacterium H6797]|nr:flagellar biosynthetic protein FliR [Acetobacteraceae bacterium H6797]